MKKKRILFVGALPPPVHGSAVVNQQIKSSELIGELFLCDWVNLSTSRQIDEIGKTTIAKPIRMMGAMTRTLWLLLTHHYDLCYLAITCHGRGFLKDLPFVLLCKLFRRKIVIHQHNKGMSNYVDRWPYSWLLPICYRNAKVILLSWHLYPDIEGVVPRENVVICPNGIKTNNGFNGLVRRHEDGIPSLLFLSNLIESKGVFVLLDALKILVERGIQFHCTFVGRGSKDINAKAFFDEVEKRGLTSVVSYDGPKYGEEKAHELIDSDIFVFPTIEDCFPLVLLEAMSYSLPIVTTAEGAIPDEVVDGDNGFLCEKNNPDSLAESIKKLIENPDLRKWMGEQGLKRLQEHFTEEIFEARIRDILFNLSCS